MKISATKSAPKNILHTQEKQTQEKQKPITKIIKKLSFVVPADMKTLTLNAMQTSVMGTVDHPTIDGGVLNTDDGLPVIHELPHELAVEASLSPVKNQTAPSNKVIPFDDSWVRSQEVKSVLDKAVQEGKLNYVMAESVKRELPASVAIIPMVESRYRDQVVSSQGAAGTWQIMPSLARDYHLQNAERFDFKKSTQVALNHLQELYNQFGSWELAYAAYNAGNKRVLEALHCHPGAKSIADLDLPLETQQYVQKIKSINQTLMAM